MQPYEELLAELNRLSDISYAAFHQRLLHNPDIKVIGVRTPRLRAIAKRYLPDVTALMTFPDEYYEITFIKLCACSLLPYDKFIAIVGECVPLIDNWAACDCFEAECIRGHKEEFLPFVRTYLGVNKQFYQRYALVTLLHFYVEEDYLPIVFESVLQSDTSFYYVHMAVAWLIAEVIVKYYEKGIEFLKRGLLDVKTHNKAVAKARESFRLTQEQKEELKQLKLR